MVVALLVVVVVVVSCNITDVASGEAHFLSSYFSLRYLSHTASLALPAGRWAIPPYKVAARSLPISCMRCNSSGPCFGGPCVENDLEKSAGQEEDQEE